VTASAGADDRRIKTFIMNQTELRNDHCSIEKLAWTVDSDGNWMLSFDATQDPMSVPDAQRPKFVRFIQNKFYVTIRAYGLYAADDNTDQAAVGQPQLVNIPLEGFWLKRGESKRIFLKDKQFDLKKNFPLINRIEIDLQYE
jgi:hypothetical protein